jgi:hypothetical protein
MKPVKFKGSNVTIAENQKQYNPLPAYIDKSGNVVTCWKFSFRERLILLFTCRVYLHTHTFNQPLQPMKMYIENPI